MQFIWKTVLEIRDEQTIEVPAGANFLCAREQHEKIAVWYLCDPKREKEKRTILIYGTGHLVASAVKYIGTASLAGGNLMFHVFERAG